MDLPPFLTRHQYGEIRLTGHRIGLFHVVESYNEGMSAEQIQDEFPSLPLDLIRGTLAFYLAQKGEVDAYVARCREELDRQYAAHEPGPGVLKIRRIVERLRQADAAHAADPAWASLSMREKLERIEADERSQTG
jgi:uncharacterized protein (DUF433 family)